MEKNTQKWNEISKYTKSHAEGGHALVVDELTLEQLLREGLGAETAIEQILRISNDATREMSIQKQLDRMNDEFYKLSLAFRLFATD